MTTVSATDRRVILTPRIEAKEIEYGVLDSFPAYAVPITAATLRRVGAEACRRGTDWKIKVRIMDVVAGVETGHAMTSAALTMTLLDQHSRAFEASYASGGAITLADQATLPGQFTLDFEDTETPPVGLWEFILVVTYSGGAKTELARGWLEVLPAIPTS